MLCTDYTLVKHNDTTLTAEPLKCRSWQCQICNPLRKRRLIMEAQNGKPQVLLTLTVNPSVGDSADDRAVMLVSAWREVRRLAKKRYKYKSIPFLAVFERTKKGEPHLHILLRVRWIDQKWLSAQMERLMGAPIVDIRKIDHSRSIARYVSKYIGKDPHVFKGCKRYWRSLDYLIVKLKDWLAENRPAFEFKVVRQNFWAYIKDSRSRGFSIRWQDDVAELVYMGISGGRRRC